MDVQETEVQTDRVLTVPNALSLLRLLGVPALPLADPRPEARRRPPSIAADGQRDHRLPRRQDRPRAGTRSRRLGQLLDPLADRLYILATLIGLAVRDIVPLWLRGRPRRPRRGARRSRCRSCAGTATGRSPVHFLGKAATFNLLYAFPLLLLGDGTGTC